MGGGPDSALPLGAQEAPLVMNGELHYINWSTTYLHHAVENTASQNTGCHDCIFSSITLNFPIMCGTCHLDFFGI